MSEELFHKIIEELVEVQYKGKLSLFSNNEPFLDERIIEFHRYARNKLPNAYLSMFTNGSLLSLEKFEEIMKYLDYLVIDNYNDSLSVNDNLKSVYAYLQQHEELKGKVFFSVRKQNEILYSRGGQAPNKQQAKPLRSKCLLPFRQLIIRPDGKISLCCNDALGKYTLGDVNQDSIYKIWSGREYQSVREEMQRNGRKNLDLCKHCDTRTSTKSS